MKASVGIRVVLASVFASLSCFGIFEAIRVLPVLWVFAWLLLVPRGELTRPIPSKELKWTFLGIGIFVAFVLTFVLASAFLHWRPTPNVKVCHVAGVALWILWWFAIYRRWQAEKIKAKADRCA
jgi:hypothetical protein